MSFSEIIQYTILGLATAGIYAVAASGLVVTYQTSGIFNFAHGAMGMIVAYVYWELRVQRHLPAPIAIFLALFVFAPLLGAVIERVLMRHLGGASVITKIVVTIGLLVGLLGIAQVIWSGNITPPPALPRFFGDNVARFGGVNLPWQSLIVLGCAVLVAVGLAALMKGSRLGVAMRAVVDDRSLAGLNGCNPARTSMSSWMLGSFLAGLAGILIAPTLGNLDQATLTLLVINAFAAAMVGRLKSLPLTFVGAVILGLTGAYMDLGAAHMSSNPTWYSDIRGSLPAILLFIVLIVIPQDRIRVAAATERLGRVPRPTFRKGILAGIALVIGVAVVGSLLQGANLRALGVAVALAVVMLSYVPLTGYAGQISLAQLTFAGLGAYIAVVVVGPNGSLLGLLVAFAASAVIGALVALPALRLRGLYLALATMAFALVIENAVFAQDPSFSSDAARVRTTFVSRRPACVSVVHDCDLRRPGPGGAGDSSELVRSTTAGAQGFPRRVGDDRAELDAHQARRVRPVGRYRGNRWVSVGELERSVGSVGFQPDQRHPPGSRRPVARGGRRNRGDRRCVRGRHLPGGDAAPGRDLSLARQPDADPPRTGRRDARAEPGRCGDADRRPVPRTIRAARARSDQGGGRGIVGHTGT